MAESISEGTLSTFTKQVGDHVEQDEEIASIETDKIDVSVNAPEAGVITELLVSEGDTVEVGQEIIKMDAGASGGGEKTADTEAKAPASEEQPTSSDPEPKKEEPKQESKPQPKEEKAPPPPKEDKPAPPPKKEDKPKEQPKSEGIDSPFGKGSRNENRVCSIQG